MTKDETVEFERSVMIDTIRNEAEQEASEDHNKTGDDDIPF